MVVTVLLLGLLSVATVTDVLRHKIYNWNTYPGILAAWSLNGLGSILVSLDQVDPNQLRTWGWIGIGESVIGFLVCGFVLVVCFVLFRGVGGGDVKLIALAGAWLGHEQGILVMLWTFVLGGCLGLIVLVWRVGPWKLLVGIVRYLGWALRLGWFGPLDEEQRRALQPRLFLAPSALVATVIVLFKLVDIM